MTGPFLILAAAYGWISSLEIPEHVPSCPEVSGCLAFSLNHTFGPMLLESANGALHAVVVAAAIVASMRAFWWIVRL
jgi:hypothetical protein